MFILMFAACLPALYHQPTTTTVEVYAPVAPIQGGLDALTFGLTAAPPVYRVKVEAKSK